MSDNVKFPMIPSLLKCHNGITAKVPIEDDVSDYRRMLLCSIECNLLYISVIRAYYLYNNPHEGMPVDVWGCMDYCRLPHLRLYNSCVSN